VFQKTFDLFVFSSCYIALCAVLMIWQTGHLLPESCPSGRLMGFVFFSTICSYNFHWYLSGDSENPSRRIQWTRHHKIMHFILYLVGAVGAVIYFFSLRQHWLALCFGAFVTFLYSAPKLPQPIFRDLKRIAVGKTLFLAFVWMYVTTMLPVLIAGVPWTGPVILFALSRFFLIYAICILFDYRDRGDDKAEGIRSLITYLNERGIDILFFAALIVFAGASIGLLAWHYSLLSVLLLLIPGIILAALYSRAKKSFSDYLYYFLLDGLMMFSGLLMLILEI
jgi:4-hydroxybenzoate polyprenyltransferase